jgi:hypothetical protein
MTLELTPAEAESKIAQIDEAMINIKTLANNILDSAQTMTASSWQGGQAHSFGARVTQHDEDFNVVINEMTQVADKGKSDIHTLVSADDGGGNTPLA